MLAARGRGQSSRPSARAQASEAPARASGHQKRRSVVADVQTLKRFTALLEAAIPQPERGSSAWSCDLGVTACQHIHRVPPHRQSPCKPKVSLNSLPASRPTSEPVPAHKSRAFCPRCHTSGSAISAQTALDAHLRFGYSPPRFSTPHFCVFRGPASARAGCNVALFPLARPGAPAGADRERARDHRAAAGGHARRPAGGEHHAVGDRAADDDLRPHAAGIQHLPVAAAGDHAGPAGAQRRQHAADPHARRRGRDAAPPAASSRRSASSSPATSSSSA